MFPVNRSVSARLLPRIRILAAVAERSAKDGFNLLKNRMNSTMAKVSPLQFYRQVKQEVKKVTWPTKNEVIKTSIMVMIIVAIASTFFFFVDQILGWVVKLVLGLGE